jgi:cupin fold WbuC family metalloprotein
MNNKPKVIDAPLLEQLSYQASNHERLRMNYNLHTDLEDPVQRLLNALEPGTIIPIHRHLHTDEVYILLAGRIKVILYNDQKVIMDTYLLNPIEGNHGIQIPAGQWHGIEVLEHGSVIFEVKQGPYLPLSKDDILDEN